MPDSGASPVRTAALRGGSAPRLAWLKPPQTAWALLLLFGMISIIAGITAPADLTAVRDFAFVFVLGAMIGVADVFSRYQEAPMRTLGTPGAMFRIATNAAASGIALWLIKTHPFSETQSITNSTAQIMAAGFGALALLRF